MTDEEKVETFRDILEAVYAQTGEDVPELTDEAILQAIKEHEGE